MKRIKELREKLILDLDKRHKRQLFDEYIRELDKLSERIE